MNYTKLKDSLTTAIAVLFVGLTVVSCKKSDPVVEAPIVTTTPPVTVASGTRNELTKDSIFLYSKELYYWYSSLPTASAFGARSFTSNETELYALTQYSNNPTTGKPYEYVASSTTHPKYSYIDYLSNAGKTASLKADLNGTANDYGFSAMYNTTTDLRVKYVYPNSPAALQGLTRGCRITVVNGNSNLAYPAAVDFLNAAIFGTNPYIALTFIDLVGNTKSVTINSTTYNLNPILFTKVYTVGTKKVGYIVFNSFTNNVSSSLNAVFADFANQSVTEVIVDLRYNGGGYVSTSAQIANVLAPASQTGNTMFTTYYNDYLQNLSVIQRKTSVLANQPLLNTDGKLQAFTTGANGKYYSYADLDYKPTNAENIEKFNKIGALNLNRVYFIVTDRTASASELTINSLRPVVDVKLIGSTTYGKPVGFFPIRIDKFDLYIPEFETKNQVGTGGYYAGLTVDQEATEDLTKAWGDETETLLSYALSYAKNGNFVTTQPKIASLDAKTGNVVTKLSLEKVKEIGAKLDQNNFKGMIMTPSHNR